MTSPEFPLLRLGVIADPQYAPIAPNLDHGRYYANSLDKLDAAVSVFNGQDLDLVVLLGDLIDRDWDSFDPALDVLSRSRHEVLILPGNHDFAVAGDRLGAVHDKLGMPAPYYDRLIKGVRLIVTDGAEVSLFAHAPGDPRRNDAERRLSALEDENAPNAMTWNAGMSQTQTEWLAERLKAAEHAGEKAIVLGHFPLHPFTDHSLWDAPDIADIIAASPAAIAYLCGHYHAGNYGKKGAAHFLNFKGMVDTPDDNAFSILSLYEDRIEITGFGREQSRQLAL